MAEVIRSSAVELAEQIRAGRLRSADAVEAYLARIAAVDPQVGAYARVLSDRARSEARARDAEVREGRLRGPLHGVPIAIKDLMTIEGVPMGAGSSFLGTEPSRTTATAVQKLEAAGAVILGTTTLHEFALGVTSVNPHGTTPRNPWSLGLDEDTPIEHNLVTRQIEGAQKKVEQYHFDVRKHVLEYDDVMNVQRKVIYTERRKVLDDQNVRDNVLDMIERLIAAQVEAVCVKEVHPDEWDLEGLVEGLAQMVPTLAAIDAGSLRGQSADDVTERLVAAGLEAYERKEAELGPDVLREIERLVLLQTIDRKWIDHLHNMDALREGIGLRAYAQVSPLVEYQREGYDMFQATLQAIQDEAVRILFRVQVTPEQRPVARPLQPVREPIAVGARGSGGTATKLGRNDPCWCGSGKKFKKCHGREA